MRRSDREINEKSEIMQVMRKCDTCRIALNDESGFPYILPLNFGLVEKDDTVELIFHSALEGKKVELISKDNRASFEMDCNHVLASDEEKGRCTMNYESVIGKGEIIILEEKEKMEALDNICRQYHPEGFKFNPAAVNRTLVYKLVVRDMTGKRKSK